jgi:type I restriction-modification system DNA methylase subunit
MEQIQGMTKAKEETNDIKDTLKGTFHKCLDILRSEGLTGDKALRNLSYILILKLIEPQFRTTIDIQNFPYVYSGKTPQCKEHNKAILMKIVYFSELVQEEQDNLQLRLAVLWTDVLSQHPSTKNIFLKGKTFDMKRGATFKRLIDSVNSIPETTTDVLGEAYEDVIKDLMKGKVLGQFFTDTKIKKVMIKLANPQLHPDGTIDTCGDPTMGTGGFLISYMQEILSQSKKKGIELNWDFIKAGGLYGKELDPDTYQLAVSNMLISTGHPFEQLEQGDSLHDPIDRKFDVILSNPPFGVKGIKYDDFTSVLKDAYVPIKTDNTVSLFLQAIVYMLKVGGRCAVVLPDGQDLFSKTKGYANIREYLMKTCDLKEILYLPSGIFSYTPIKTCIFFFVKKCEGADVLTVATKTSPKRVTKEYTFGNKHHTKSVKFYDYNPYEEVKTLLVEVPIEKLVENAYSLNYAEYLKEDVEEYEDGLVMKTLGDLFHIEKGSLQSSKNIEGEYSFITASDTHKTHQGFTHDCESVMLVGGAEGSLAKAQYFNGKFIASDLLYILTRKNETEINYRYIWYYLNLNREKHLSDDTICCGTPKKMISKDRCSAIKIPIPSLERQQEIVDDLDFISETNKASTSKITDLKRLNEFCLRQQRRFGENEVKTLGEVCTFEIGGTPLRSKNEYYENGTNLWVSVRELNGGYIYDTKEKISDLGVEKSSVKRFEKETILFSFKLSIGKTAIVGTPLYTNEAIAGILSKDTALLMNKYLYYYLTINDFSNLGAGIFSNGSLNKKSIGEIPIIIPSLERQQEIVDYCHQNHALIQQLEQEIERNQEMAKQFMSGLSKH